MDFKEYRSLGRTGLKVSRLGIASGYGIDAASIEKAYHEHGINYFYWSSPRKKAMGEALRNLSRKHREKIVIALQSYDHSGLYLRRSLESGLRALGVDQVDFLLLGWFNYYPKRVVDKALRLKEEGKIGGIALSGHNRSNFAQIAQRDDNPIDVFMIRYNAAHRGAEDDIFPHLPQGNRPGVTIYTATSWGKLLQQKKMPPVESAMSAAQCYRFALSHPDVDLCMMGPKNKKQLAEGLLALDEGPLSEEEAQRIQRIGDHVHG